MATIQIKNLSEETVRVWKVRAASSGKSLQEYMRQFLTDEASKPTVEELFDKIEATAASDAHENAFLDPELTLQYIREDRESH